MARKTWENLRDTFRRKYKTEHETKSGQGATAPNKWPYFNSMLFLKDIMTPKVGSGNLPATVTNEPFSRSPSPVMANQESENEFESATSCSVTEPEASTSFVQPQVQETKRQKKTKQTNLNYDSQALAIEKRKIDLMEQHFSGKAQKYQDDEDYSFLMSLLPTIKQLDQLEKMKLRMKILKDVTEALEAHNFVNDVRSSGVIPSPVGSNLSSRQLSPMHSPSGSIYSQHSSQSVLQCVVSPEIISPTSSNYSSAQSPHQNSQELHYTVL